MVTQIDRKKLFFAFSPDIVPAERVQQGEEVLLETHDCFEGQIQTSADLVDSLDWNHVNPATGPVYIEGAKPGDVLRVELLEIKIGDQASMVTIPGEGALGDVITEMETAILKRVGESVIFKDKIRIPIQPMIGVIGVAPAEGSVPNGTPGPHGGNLDCKLMRQGSIAYFTVGVEGALFGAGDFHAVMGDGEIVVCGAEIPGELRFRARVVPELKGSTHPLCETDDLVSTIFSAPTADEAAHGVHP